MHTNIVITLELEKTCIELRQPWSSHWNEGMWLGDEIVCVGDYKFWSETENCDERIWRGSQYV